MRRSYPIVAAFVVLIFQACSKEPTRFYKDGWVFSDPAFASMFQRQAPLDQSSIKLWARDDLELHVEKQEWARWHESAETLMFSFYDEEAFLNFVSDDSGLIAYHLPKNLRPGYALVRASSPARSQRYAEFAHESSGFCGAIEVLKRGVKPFSLIESTTVDPLIPEDFSSSTLVGLIEQSDQARIESVIEVLERLGTRGHLSTNGLATPAKILELITNEVGSLSPYAESEYVDHSSTDQQSLIVRFQGTTKSNQIIVVGAHLDSINKFGTDDAPGADDDASGVATLIEIVRILVENQVNFERTVEFQFYAAEEVGLRGSQEIAEQYANEAKSVKAMLQIDMNAYSKTNTKDRIFFISNDTNANLNRSLKELMKTYLDSNYEEKDLPAGTSDHRSWTMEGFPASFPFENPYNYNEALHTSEDTLEVINNLELSNRFVALGLSFVGHHGGLNGVVDDFESSQYAQVHSNGDLFLSLYAPKNDEAYYLGVSAPEHSVRVESCFLSDKDDFQCSTTLQVLDFLGASAGAQQIFVSSRSSSISEGDILKVEAFDDDDILIAKRLVSIKAR